MKISVLTAVYNTAAYLPECLDSILRQTHEDWQLICIDDASTDGSWDILQEYAARDRRITLLRNECNMGQAKARNRGIAVADGDLITMVDSDDWISPDAFEKICAVFGKYPSTDCVLFELEEVSPNGECRRYPLPERRCYSGEEACRLSIDWTIHGVYTARRVLFERWPYDDACRVFSDDNTTRVHYLKSREVRVCDAVYYYRKHAVSVSRQRGIGRLEILPALRSLRQTLLVEGLPSGDVWLVDLMLWRNVMGGWMYYYACRKKMTSDEKRRVREMLEAYYRSTDTSRLPIGIKWRFGYAPLKCCPLLYRMQMLVFTRLRLLLGLDKDRY